MRTFQMRLAISVLMLGAATNAPAQAPAGGAASLEEIVVTARRREENVQNVPSTLNVFSQDSLAQSGITDSFALQSRTPGLAIAVADREVNVAIRGIGNNVRSIGADPSNAASLNGVYLPRAAMVLSQLYDLARVEVLKGPQGTLYGRNATGGAINIVSEAPTQAFSGSGYAGFGSYGLRHAEADISGGNDHVAVRLAAVNVNDDGYTHNLSKPGDRFDDTNYTGVRGTVAFTPTEHFKATLFWQYGNDKGGLGYGISLDPALGTDPNGSYAALIPASLQRVDPRHIRIDAPQFSRRAGNVGGLTLDWSLDNVGLRSITGYTRYRDRDSQDTDNTAFPVEYQATSQQYRSASQEFQVYSVGDRRLEWLAGVFLYKDKGGEQLDYRFNVAALSGGLDYQPLAQLLSSAKSESEALYGQATFHLTDTFALIAGGRYSHDEKSATRLQTSTVPLLTPVEPEIESDKFTPSVQAQWTPQTDLMVYASATQGFKTGGINSQDTSGHPTFGPEKVWSYETGIKSRLLDRRVTFNASAFYMDYQSIQLRSAVIVPGQPILVSVTNGSSAKIKGAEVLLESRLGAGFAVDFTGAWLDTDVRNFVSPATQSTLSGIPLPLAPKWSGSAGLAYLTALGNAGSVRARVEYNYRSEIAFPFTYGRTESTDGSLGLVNATLRWTASGGHYYLEAIGLNLSDSLYRVNRGDFLPTGVFDAFGPPRTYQLRAGVDF